MDWPLFEASFFVTIDASGVKSFASIEVKA